MLKMRTCVYSSRRLQWIVIDCKRNLQQRQKILYKKKLSVHTLRVPPHIKIVCAPVRLTWEDHLSSSFHSEECDESANITGLPAQVCCTLNELRGTFWLSNLVFSGLSDALGKSDIEKLVHSPYQHPPAPCLRNYGIGIYPSQVSMCLSWILNFCSLALLHRHCLIGWVSQQLLFWWSRRTQVSPCLPFKHVYLTQ